MASASLPPMSPVPGVPDAWTVRRGSAFCAIGLALFLAPAFILAILSAVARTVSIGRGVVEFLIFFLTPLVWLAAGVFGVVAIGTVAVHGLRGGGRSSAPTSPS